jgi:transcriptional regulator with XRE-family HTH domain
MQAVQENTVMIMSRMRIDKESFGKFIAERREKIKGVHTQVLLAQRLNVSKGTIGKIETGERLPSLELLIDLADALLMTPGELIMVLAKREPGDKNYMEMNDWVYEQIAQIMLDYEKRRDPIGLPPLRIRPRFEPNEQAYQGLDQASDITDKMNQPPTDQEQPLPEPDSEDETP